MDAFKVMLDGGYFWFQGVNQQPYSNPLTPALFALSVFGILALFLAAKRDKGTAVVRNRTYTVAVLLLVLALLIAVGLALTSAVGWLGMALMLATLFLTIVGGAILTWATIQGRITVAAAGWVFLAAMALAGPLWWFGGAGRPDTRAPGAFLGLWPIDGAGILFWVCAAGLLIVLGADPQPATFQRPTVAAMAMIGLLVVQSTITVSGLWSTHLLLALPLPQMVIAAFAVLSVRAIAGRLSANWQASRLKWMKILPATLLLSTIVIGDVAVDGLYHRDLSVAGVRPLSPMRFIR